MLRSNVRQHLALRVPLESKNIKGMVFGTRCLSELGTWTMWASASMLDGSWCILKGDGCW